MSPRTSFSADSIGTSAVDCFFSFFPGFHFQSSMPPLFESYEVDYASVVGSINDKLRQLSSMDGGAAGMTFSR
jgi:hypothetical protein